MSRLIYVTTALVDFGLSNVLDLANLQLAVEHTAVADRCQTPFKDYLESHQFLPLRGRHFLCLYLKNCG